VDRLVEEAGGPAWDAAAFAALREAVRADLVDAVTGVVAAVRAVLATAYEVGQRLDATRDPALAPAVADIRRQLAGLIHPGFVTETGWRHLHQVPRYLRAIAYRLDRLPGGVARDRQLMAQVHEIESEYRELRAALPASDPLSEIRWMIEELRVGLFAQSLGTAYPVSDKRIYRAMDQLPS